MLAIIIHGSLGAGVAEAARQREYASALLMEAETGQLLFSENADREWIPASVVKLMLLLLAEEAMEDGRIAATDTVTASARAQRQGGSQIFLGAGEKASFQKLLEATAVGSANDAAMAVATALYGSSDRAVAAMNARAAELGMSATRYVNVTGLPERGEENRSTARDQARLAREIVLGHPGVLAKTRLTWTRFRKGLVIPCTNVLLKEFPGLDGLKTGFHHKARSNIVATAVRDGRRLIVVVLGSPGPKRRNQVVSRLLERGFADWELVTALGTGEGFGDEFPVAKSWRGTVSVLASRPLRFALRPADRPRVRIRLSEDARLEAPLREGQVLGAIEAWLGDRKLGSVPALAGAAVSRSWIDLPFGKVENEWPELGVGARGIASYDGQIDGDG